MASQQLTHVDHDNEESQEEIFDELEYLNSESNSPLWKQLVGDVDDSSVGEIFKELEDLDSESNPLWWQEVAMTRNDIPYWTAAFNTKMPDYAAQAISECDNNAAITLVEKGLWRPPPHDPMSELLPMQEEEPQTPPDDQLSLIQIPTIHNTRNPKPRTRSEREAAKVQRRALRTAEAIDRLARREWANFFAERSRQRALRAAHLEAQTQLIIKAAGKEYDELYEQNLGAMWDGPDCACNRVKWMHELHPSGRPRMEREQRGEE